VFVDILALILGILFTIRRLDVRKREPEQFPQVDPAAFARWKRTELGAYMVGSTACFMKILVDYSFRFIASRTGLDWNIVRAVGGSIFLAWVIAMLYAFFRTGRGRRLREELGINLAQAPEPPRDPEDPEGRSDHT
jgi:hypothetical protein